MNEEMNPIPDPECGDHMTMEKFRAACECNAFIDYDGFATLATETEERSGVNHVYPSQIVAGIKIDPKWTHVVWYNR